MLGRPGLLALVVAALATLVAVGTIVGVIRAEAGSAERTSVQPGSVTAADPDTVPTLAAAAARVTRPNAFPSTGSGGLAADSDASNGAGSWLALLVGALALTAIAGGAVLIKRRG